MELSLLYMPSGECGNVAYLIKRLNRFLEKGEVLKDYPDDKPYPSKLILGFVNDMPVHLVLAKDENGVCIIITVYIPDSDIWNTDFRTKKQDV